MEVKLKERDMVILLIFLIALFSFIFFGLAGFRTIIGFILLFFLPFYLILDNFNLEKDEKIVFSFFIGIIIFPSLVYLLGRIISVKISIVISFVFFILIGLLLRKFGFKYKKGSDNNAQ